MQATLFRYFKTNSYKVTPDLFTVVWPQDSAAPPCVRAGVGAARQLVPIFVATRQKHATRGIERILFLKPDAWY